jgi:hypothetical protein
MIDDNNLRAILIGVVVTLFFMLWVSAKPPSFTIPLDFAQHRPPAAFAGSEQGAIQRH